MNKNALTRFGIIARVSTEAQAMRGESLRSQTAQMEAAVYQLGGQIDERYSGQEHATPGSERKILKRLLSDAENGKLDAVMVTDFNRWSRGNQEADAGLDVLLGHGVRFFILTQEQDLENEDVRFMLGVNTGVNKQQAQKMKRISALNRIKRAIRGHVSSSFPPYARRVVNADQAATETAVWISDGDKEKLVQRAARLYLAGGPWPSVAEELGGNAETWRRRVLAAGDTWTQRFKRITLKQWEIEVNGHLPENVTFDGNYFTVTTRIPPLLPEDVIRDVRTKSHAVYEDRRTSKVYALSRFLRCDACGSVLSIHTHSATTAYVQHHSKTRREGCFAGAPRYDEIEKSVLLEMGGLLQNVEKLERAAWQAHASEYEARPVHEEELKQAKKERLLIDSEINSLMENMRTHVLKPGSPMHRAMQSNIDQVDNRKEANSAKVARLERELKVNDGPSDLQERVRATIENLKGNRGTALFRWRKEKLREFMKLVFGAGSLKGRTTDGELRHEAGIFLKRLEAGTPMTKLVWAGPRKYKPEKWTLQEPAIVWVARGWFGSFSGTTSDVEALQEEFGRRFDEAQISDPALTGMAALAVGAVPSKSDMALKRHLKKANQTRAVPIRWSGSGCR